MKRILTTIAAAAVAILPLTIQAGPDENQRQMIQRMQQQKQKAAAEQAAQSAERNQIMAEHMKMMEQTMARMQSMKPRAGMSAKEKDEWIVMHQDMMDRMTGHLMQEHHMMMQSMHK